MQEKKHRYREGTIELLGEAGMRGEGGEARRRERKGW